MTSEVRTYTVHVGDLSDVSVGITASNAAPEVGDRVTYTVTASNAGPDTAGDAEVSITLPTGLSNPSPSTGTGSYDSATGIWSVGDLANGASATLTLTATVADNTHGQALTVTATIKAYETIGSSTVAELDPREGDNSAAVTVTPVAATNVNPLFEVSRSVAENSTNGTLVGNPIAVREPDAGDTLTFGLTGDGARNFTVAADANGNAQVSVAEGAHLNYEVTPSYDLVLTVSDGEDADGNADSAVDHSIALNVSVENVAEPVTATMAATATSGTVTWTFTVTNVPEGTTDAFFRYTLRNTATGYLSSGAESRDSLVESLTFDDVFPYDSGTYRVEGSIQYAEGGATHHVHADISGDQTITIP